MPLHSDDIIVTTLHLGSTSVLCNNNDIILVTGYTVYMNYLLYGMVV